MATREERYDEAVAVGQAGQMDRAVELLESLIADEPDYALPHAAMCVFCSKLEKHDEAIEYGKKVCLLEPEDPFSFVSLSMICQKAGRLGEAEQAMMDARKAQLEMLRSENEKSDEGEASS